MKGTLYTPSADKEKIDKNKEKYKKIDYYFSTTNLTNLTNVTNVTNLICVYFASKFDKNAYLEIKIYKTE